MPTPTEAQSSRILAIYPFGNREFSDLVHYVRSGDFVRPLLIESQNVNEYAFALEALSHYASDISGRPAVNQSVAIQYPKLRVKYGRSVRYAQDKTAHLKTEFGFDPVEVAKNRCASQQYHDFIGFQVSKSLLDREFPVVHTEDLYIKSINTTADQYRALVQEVRTDRLVLANCDFDSGQPTKPAEYSLTDDAYAKLLAQLSKRKFGLTSRNCETDKNAVRWQSVLTELDQLKAAAPVQTGAGSPAQ